MRGRKLKYDPLPFSSHRIKWRSIDEKYKKVKPAAFNNKYGIGSKEDYRRCCSVSDNLRPHPKTEQLHGNKCINHQQINKTGYRNLTGI